MLLHFLLSMILYVATTGSGQHARPKITGVAHVRVYARNVEETAKFYTAFLGLRSRAKNCGGKAELCFAVNDQQEIQIVPAGDPPENTFLAEVAFATDDLAGMRRYLLAHDVAAGAIAKNEDGSQYFALRDPENHALAFVQLPANTSFSPDSKQVSARLLHAGFVVRDSATEDRFYREILGFKLYWHGGFKETNDDWEELQVPDGSDWIEYMLNIPAAADHRELGVQNHFSLGVKSMNPALGQLRANGLQTEATPQIGRDGKMQLNLYDPDATRVEFMEFEPSQQPCCNAYTAPHPKP